MSAFNVIIEPDRAFVWSDTAFIDRHDVIVSMERMCAPIEGMKAVVSCFGMPTVTTYLATVLAAFHTHSGITFDDHLDSRGAHVDTAMAQIAHWFEKGPAQVDAIWLVGWSETSQAPRCLQFDREDGWRLVDSVIMPGLTDAAIHLVYEHVGPTDGQGFSKARFGVPIMEAQRLLGPAERAGLERQHHAAGRVREMIITAEGVSDKIVHEWPEDVVGAPWRPSSQFTLAANTQAGKVTGMNRAARRREKSGRAQW